MSAAATTRRIVALFERAASDGYSDFAMRAAFGCGMDNVASKTEAYVVKLRAQQGCTTDDQRSQIDEHIVKKYSALLTKKTSEYFEGRAATADLLERHGCDACAARIQLARIVKARSDAGKGWLLSTAQPASALWAKGGRLSASEQYGGALRVAVASPPSVERLVERINAARSSGDAAAHAGMKLADALKSVAGILGKSGVNDPSCSLVVYVERPADAGLRHYRSTLALVDAVNTAYAVAFPGDEGFLQMLVVLQGCNDRATVGGMVIDGIVEELTF